MERIFLADKNRLFRHTLKFYLEKEELAKVVADEDQIENLISHLDLDGIVICEFIDNKKFFDSIKAINRKLPDLKFIITAYHLNNSNYSRLINAGVKGCLLKSNNLTDLKDAVNEVAHGKIYFPQEILQQVMSQFTDKTHKADVLTDRELEILHLLCEGLSNEDISKKLHLSCDTVKWHRGNIFMKCGCKNILSLYKYAVKTKLIQASSTHS
jgi:DNA-binding NarL/FixJ family response regulator